MTSTDVFAAPILHYHVLFYLQKVYEIFRDTGKLGNVSLPLQLT